MLGPENALEPASGVQICLVGETRLWVLHNIQLI